MEAFPRKTAERDAFLTTLKTVEVDYFKPKAVETPQLKVVRNNMRRWIALAASVTLIAAAMWFFSQSGSPTYEQYAQHTPLSLTVMGNTEQAKTEAESAFGQKDFARALAAMDQVLTTEPNNIKAVLYRGICLLELGRTADARVVFEPLATGNSALREDSAPSRLRCGCSRPARTTRRFSQQPVAPMQRSRRSPIPAGNPVALGCHQKLR